MKFSTTITTLLALAAVTSASEDKYQNPAGTPVALEYKDGRPLRFPYTEFCPWTNYAIITLANDRLECRPKSGIEGELGILPQRFEDDSQKPHDDIYWKVWNDKWDEIATQKRKKGTLPDLPLPPQGVGIGIGIAMEETDRKVEAVLDQWRKEGKLPSEERMAEVQAELNPMVTKWTMFDGEGRVPLRNWKGKRAPNEAGRRILE